MKRLIVTVVVTVLALGCARAARRDPRGDEEEHTGTNGPAASQQRPGRGEGRQEKAPKSESGVPLAASPEDMLVEGGPLKIQQALNARGFKTGKAGKIDSETEAALREFQAQQGLPRTGIPDRATLSKLGLDPDELMKKQAVQ